uniref:Copine, putative n=1 Tax=Schistosoma mansoni TaxID=6183 RepID=A0A3Q0KS66_SCHMA
MPHKPRIQIGISCRNIPKLLKASYAKFSVSYGGYLHEKHVTETELVYNNLSPNYTTRLNLEYCFEEKQIITTEIFECEREDRENSVLLGYIQCTVGRVIHSGGELILPITWNEDIQVDRNTSTEVVVCIREDPFSKENIFIKMNGANLDKKDFFGKSDPYVIIYRRNERGKLQKCYRSEVIKNTLFPDWKPILICLDRLCGGNIDCELYFRCFDWDGAVGDSEDVDTEIDDLIGEFNTTVSRLLNSNENGIEFQLINMPKKKRKKCYQNSGLLTVKLYFAQSKFSFLDYIFGGLSINVVVAVDMSTHASMNSITNTPSQQIELSQSHTEYEVAIQAVMEILQEYDSDQLFPAFGFGAKVSSGGKLSHRYPLVNVNNCYCKGMVGVLSAYRRCLTDLYSSGPILFSPIIREVSEAAKRSEAADNYYVLLILTNGTVDDWIETKKSVIETSFLPISIIVLGVGGGKFSEMEILDQDFGLLKVGQEQACRDNVQFVQMRRFLRLAADGSDSIRWSKVALAKEVLAELPSQILEYLDKNHLSPQHLVPRQAEKLSDLTNPDWWRRFTQPLSENHPNPSEDENDALQRLQLIDKNNQPTTSSSNSPISSTSSDQYYCKSGQIFNLSDNNNNSTLNEMKSYSMNQSSPKKTQIPLYRQMSLGTTKLTENYPTKTRFRRLPSGLDTNINTNRITSNRSNNNNIGNNTGNSSK